MTPDTIIQTVCEALELDRDKLISDKLIRNRKHTDGRHIAIYLIRERVSIPKGCKKSLSYQAPTKTGRATYKEKVTYKEIAYIFKHKQHGTAMNSELECKTLLKVDKEFKQKFDMVVNLLDSRVNIA